MLTGHHPWICYWLHCCQKFDNWMRDCLSDSFGLVLGALLEKDHLCNPKLKIRKKMLTWKFMHHNSHISKLGPGDDEILVGLMFGWISQLSTCLDKYYKRQHKHPRQSWLCPRAKSLFWLRLQVRFVLHCVLVLMLVLQWNCQSQVFKISIALLKNL